MLPGPGGVLDLQQTTFHQHDARSVRLAGSRFVPSDVYIDKLEGARRVGNRTVSIAGARDPSSASSALCSTVRVTPANSPSGPTNDTPARLAFSISSCAS